MAIIASDSLALLESRLSAARAGYLDNLSVGAVALASNLTSARAGYLDNLSAGAVALEATAQAIPTTPIKQIIYLAGSVDIGASDDDVTIAAIVIAKTSPQLLNVRSNTANPLNSDDALTCYLPNTTTFRVESYSTASGTATGFNAWLIEFN